MTIDALPKSLLIDTFSYLDLKDISNCAQTCKTWRKITQDERLWQLFCSKLGHETLAHPGCTWQTSCKINLGKIFSHGEVTTSSIQMRSLKHFFHTSIEPRVHKDLLAFYRPESDTFELWNLSESVCIHQFRTSEKEVLTRWLLPSLWKEKGYLELNDKYLVYALSIGWEPKINVYIWDVKEESILPTASFSLCGKNATIHLSYNTLLIRSFQKKTTKTEIKNVTNFSIYDLDNLITTDKECSPRPKYQHTDEKNDYRCWEDNLTVHYQSSFFYFGEGSPSQLDRFDIQAQKGHVLSVTPSKGMARSPRSSVQLSGQYLSAFFGDYINFQNYCSAIRIWDFENYKMDWETDPTWLSDFPLDAMCARIDEKLIVILKNSSISIFDIESSTRIRTIKCPSGFFYPKVYSHGNFILILGRSKAYTLRFT